MTLSGTPPTRGNMETVFRLKGHDTVWNSLFERKYAKHLLAISDWHIFPEGRKTTIINQSSIWFSWHCFHMVFMTLISTIYSCSFNINYLQCARCFSERFSFSTESTTKTSLFSRSATRSSQWWLSLTGKNIRSQVQRSVWN